jgi:hypothetical protein
METIESDQSAMEDDQRQQLESAESLDDDESRESEKLDDEESQQTQRKSARHNPRTHSICPV